VASVTERGLRLGPESVAAHRADLTAFVERAARLDPAAVIRLRARPGGLVAAWAATGFDVLASRAVSGTLRPDDLSVGADELARGLAATDSAGYVNPGFPMDSAWRGALPPVSLLDQEVIRVSAADVSVGVPMRCVFALTAMGFLPQSSEAVAADEIVRVRTLPAWLRIDARFGSVYRRRGDPALVLR